MTKHVLRTLQGTGKSAIDRLGGRHNHTSTKAQVGEVRTCQLKAQQQHLATEVPSTSSQPREEELVARFTEVVM